jgi:SAM-dependent methyltransferase
MLKIINKIQFSADQNRMKNIADIENAVKEFNLEKNKNLDFLLQKRFSWMKKFIQKNDKGVEVGAGGGFSKKFIKNKNFKISDLAQFKHLDHKNVDAQKTNFEDNSYDFVIAVNMIHHVPYPTKFFDEMYRILKTGGKLIIQEANCSLIFQLVTLLMRHEGFDFTKNVWSKDKPLSDEHDVWSGNIAVPHLIFDNDEIFNKNLGTKFSFVHQKFYECFIFLNSGGVSSKTFYIPMNATFLKILDYIDNIVTKLFPRIFAMGRQIVLIKN